MSSLVVSSLEVEHLCLELMGESFVHHLYTANCTGGRQLLHIIEGETPSLPLELAAVPSLLLMSQKPPGQFQFQSAATSQTMTLLMSSSVGCETMLKWVGVSVEGETRVGVGNHSLV